MRINRKRFIIASFILLDFLVGGVLVGSLNAGSTTTSITKKTYKNNTEVVAEVNSIGDSLYDKIGSEVLTQEDIAVAQSIMINEQSEIMEKTSAISEVVSVSSNVNTSIKKTENKVKEENKRKEEISSLNSQIINESSSDIVKYAVQFNGKAYVSGGQWNGEMPYVPTDCSGFTRGVYKHFGIDLPRTASAQSNVGVEIPISKIQPGDLVFYSSGGNVVTHAALYIGNGKIMHARTPRLGVGIDSVFLIFIRLHIRRITK